MTSPATQNALPFIRHYLLYLDSTKESVIQMLHAIDNQFIVSLRLLSQTPSLGQHSAFLSETNGQRILNLPQHLLPRLTAAYLISLIPQMREALLRLSDRLLCIPPLRSAKSPRP